MTATVTDLFCGAGGSSTGAAAAGMEIVMAANHWSTAIDVHQANHPDAAHDCADITQVDPRRYPRTDVLLASPECTNHSQARGVSRRRQDPSLWDAPDPAAERSRATMWDVGRFAEQMHYDAIVVENVVEATKWAGWRHWLGWILDQGYEHRVLSHNSMHHGVPQSRDRIYVVFWRKGLKPDLEFELDAFCPGCAGVRVVRQAWKPGRSIGRYRQQWLWACTACGRPCEPATQPAASIIDWGRKCPRIGDRCRPLAAATRRRIHAGLERYGWVPITTSGAGNVWEHTPGMRARPIDHPLPVQQTTATTALATPPGFLVQTAHGAKDGRFEDSRTRESGRPLWTVTASDDRPSLVLTNRTNGVPRPTTEPLSTVCAGGNHHGLVVRNYGNKGGDPGRHVTPASEPFRTVTASPGQALLMRNNSGGPEMLTPVDEPARTMTTKGHQSLVVPYYGTGTAQPTDRPIPTVPTRDRFALVDVEQLINDCGFRMLEPYEIALAMAFPEGYIPRSLTKRDQVRLAGNAVTPPVTTWITGRILQALAA